MKREEILHEAEKCVCGGREQDYGAPEKNFGTIAEFWDTYIKATTISRGGIVSIEPQDVAAMMSMVKIERIASAPRPKADNWIDLAGYAACGGEIETE